MKTFEEFIVDIKNEELQQALKAFIAAAKPENEEEKMLALADFAVQKGYEVTPEQLSVERARQKKLDDSELEAVSGGEWCGEEYSCFWMWHHDHCAWAMH